MDQKRGDQCLISRRLKSKRGQRIPGDVPIHDRYITTHEPNVYILACASTFYLTLHSKNRVKRKISYWIGGAAIRFLKATRSDKPNLISNNMHALAITLLKACTYACTCTLKLITFGPQMYIYPSCSSWSRLWSLVGRSFHKLSKPCGYYRDMNSTVTVMELSSRFTMFFVDLPLWSWGAPRRVAYARQLLTEEFL